MVAPSVSRKRPIADTSPFKSAKRPRVHGRPHETYYFPDGNVVLQLRDIQFKVHLSQLARKSNSFKELFDGPDHEITAEGHKIYACEDDPKDFEALLRCVYDGMQFLDADSVNFNLLASIVRASTRYGFHALRDWAIKCLEALFPPNMEALSSSPLTSPSPSGSPNDRVDQAATAVSLARQFNLQRILKPALYRMISLGNLSARGTDSSGPSTPTKESSSFSSLALAESPASNTPDELLPLTRQDLLLALTIQRFFTDRWLAISTSVPNPKCPLPKSNCGSAFTRHWWTSVVKSPYIFQAGVLDPLGSLDKLIAIDWSANGVCEDCLKNERKGWKGLKERIWEEMDEWIRWEGVKRTPSTISVVGIGMGSKTSSPSVSASTSAPSSQSSSEILITDPSNGNSDTQVNGGATATAVASADASSCTNDITTSASTPASMPLSSSTSNLNSTSPSLSFITYVIPNNPSAPRPQPVSTQNIAPTPNSALSASSMPSPTPISKTGQPGNAPLNPYTNVRPIAPAPIPGYPVVGVPNSKALQRELRARTPTEPRNLRSALHNNPNTTSVTAGYMPNGRPMVVVTPLFRNVDTAVGATVNAPTDSSGSQSATEKSPNTRSRSKEKGKGKDSDEEVR